VAQTGASAIFQWPSYPGGFHLESTPKLNAASTWTVVTNAAQIDLNQTTVTLQTPDPTRFFRLVR
jgi:hypothetical protein